MRNINILGIFKDKLSLAKLTLLSKPNTLHLHTAVLRTTTHSPSTPPNTHHLTTLLSLGDNSRATASIIIHSLNNRLHRTHNAHVALKCLYTIHHIIKHGPFILKDQLSVSTNGRNNLKLSNFNDQSSNATWVLSVYVRWYARYIETFIFTSKNMEFVVSSSKEKEKQEDMLASFMNSDLINEFRLLVGVIEEICKVPDNLLVERGKLIQCVMESLASDYLMMVNEIMVRVSEFKERVDLLSYNDSVELASGLDRLISCKERLLQLFSVKKISVETLWEMVEKLNNKIGINSIFIY